MEVSRKSSAGDGNPAAMPPSITGRSNSVSKEAENMSKVVDVWSLMFFTGAMFHCKDTEKGIGLCEKVDNMAGTL